MIRVCILLIFVLSFGAASLAQKPPSFELQTLTQEAFEYYLSDPDTALILTQRALELAIETGDTYYEGFAYFLFLKTYWVKTNYQLSNEYGFKALKKFEGSPHFKERGRCLVALARNLVELGNYAKAHAFIHEAVEIGIEHDEDLITAAGYREHSYLLTELNQLDSALYYSDKGISLFEKLGDSLDISVLYGRKSRIYFIQKDFQKSKDFAYRALTIDSLVGNRRGLGISYFQAGQNEYALGNHALAISQLKHSIRINSEIGNLNWQIKAHELLSEFYLDNNKMALAAAELKKVSKFKDELYNSEKNGQIQEMQSLHELEAKVSTIQLLENENSLKQQQVKNQRLFVAFLLVAVLFLILLIFVLTRLRTIQNKTNRNLASQNIAIEQQRVAIESQAENLRQIDLVKTKLFSVISHDLRGPIANLQSLLDMFTKRLMTAEEFINLSGKLKENLNVTQRTLENLLNWSLSQMGGIKTDRQKIPVDDCIEEACKLMDEVAARKNIVLERKSDGPMSVLADANQLQVILRNLIHNAIKFSSFNATIGVHTYRNNKYCHITIKDCGIGMAENEISTIVDSNDYFSKAGTEQEKGTGLGLLLCKEFINRNGGNMTIESKLGAGTSVSFTLLLAEQEAVAAVTVA